MNRLEPHHAALIGSAYRSRLCWSLLVASFLLTAPIVEASGFKSPPECLAYSGEAHLNCLYAYIEIQKDKLAKFDEELKSQKGALGQLQNQVDRQASITEDLQRRLSQPAAPPSPPSVAIAPAYYPPFAYPPVIGGVYPYPPFGGGLYGYPSGFSFSVGPGFYYGPTFGFSYYRFFGPRWHHHR